MIYNDISEFISMKPAHYRFLKFMQFTRMVGHDGCGRFNIELIVSRIIEGGVEDLRLQCVNAFDVRIGDIESISGIQVDIEDVSNRQIEGASYKVFEVEEGAFSFYCEDFFAEKVSAS